MDELEGPASNGQAGPDEAASTPPPSSEATPHKSESLWSAVFDRWLAGLLFALALSAFVIVAAKLTPLGSVTTDIEQSGIDIGMMLRARHNPLGTIGRERTLTAGYVSVDIDATTCAWIEHSSLCASRTPASPAAAAYIGAAAIASGARAVILDVRLWDEGPAAPSYGQAFLRLAKAARDHPGTVVVAAAPFRPTGTNKGVIDASLIPASLRSGTIHFAPAYAWNKGVIVRDYPTVIDAEVEGRREAIASLPYLASLLLSDQSSERKKGQCLALPRLTRCSATAQRFQEAESEARPLFTLPSLYTDELGASPYRSTYLNFYDWHPSSELFTPDFAQQVTPAIFAGKVVVIGASAAVAEDRHETPLGRMAGSEIILNVLRAFSAEALLPEPSLAGSLCREGFFAVIGSLPFFLFWAVLIGAPARFGPLWSRLRLDWILPVLLFPLTIALAARLLIAAGTWQIGGNNLSANAWDMLTPLVGLGLECFADGSKVVSTRLERAVEHWREVLSGRWRRATEQPGEQT